MASEKTIKIKTYKDDLKRKGICIDCAVNRRHFKSASRCRKCLDKIKDMANTIRSWGYCGIHNREKLIPGLSICTKCRTSKSEVYKLRRREGLCVIHGTTAIAGSAICTVCRTKNSKSYSAVLSKGICGSCRDRPVVNNTKRCAECTLARRGNVLIRNYGLDLNGYEKLLRRQRGVCAICKKPETRKIHGRIHSMPVDHDHVTGKIRGLLCTRCNRCLGLFEDNAELLNIAAKYLRRHR